MSEVWLAHDLELDRPVALKLLAPTADTARFEREARAAAGLNDTNVTRLYDFGHAAGRPFMVFEYLRGGTLEHRLQQGALADEDTRRVATDVASGLAHAHTHGVVHRDLKPANVLFDDEGRAKLADFGIARLEGGSGTFTEAGTLLGTAAYISPEQAAGAPAGTASDVYSFGVILHRMLTGRLPFESDEPLELIRLHRDVDAPPVTTIRADVPPALAAAVDAMLTRDPARRPQDGAAALNLVGLPTAVALPAATETTRIVAPPPRRRRRVSALAAVLAALAVAGAALAWELAKPANSSAPTTSHTAGRRPQTRPTTSRPTTTPPAVLPTTTAATTSSTAPTTTHSATTTAAQTTTTRPATTTTRTPTTTHAVPTTTAAVPTTTAILPTTTAELPTTSIAATTTASIETTTTTIGP
jgi:serine/threonine-protein kinase